VKKKKVSLVVPCYNEEKNVGLFYDECKKSFKKCNFKLELVFVNDGSKDETLEILKQNYNKGKKDKIAVKVISFSRNFGKEAAMYAGLENATGDYIGIIDADLQQRPDLVKDMVKELDEDDKIDCVCYYQEKRIENRVVSFLKKKFYKFITKISEVEFVEGASDFRLFRKYVVDAILSLSEKNRFSKGIFSWVGFNTKYLPYTPDERMYGKSSFSLKGLFKYALSGILAFSVAPLKISTYLGLLFSSLSFIYLIVVLIQKIFFSINVPGYATLISCLLLIGGLILFALGIIGEYLSRLYLEVKNRPIYLVRDYFDSEEK